MEEDAGSNPVVPIKMANYRSRLAIDPDVGNPSLPFYTMSGLLVATGYTRVVVGQRGPYIEFSDDQIVKANLHIPEKEQYRLTADYVYYHEYRTNQDYVMFYFQRKPVLYADYREGFWYASPFELKTDHTEHLVKPTKQPKPQPMDIFEEE